MALTAMIVCDKNGLYNYLGAPTYKHAANSSGGEDPYGFYATSSDHANCGGQTTDIVYMGKLSTSEKQDITDKKHPVTLVMPVGGVETGIGRFPKLGERVLVDDDGATSGAKYYLMGYLPSTTQKFSKNDTPDKDNTYDGFVNDGFSLRYKSQAPGKTQEYSEIGFSNNKGIDAVTVLSNGSFKLTAGKQDSETTFEIDADGKVTISAATSIELKAKSSIQLKVGRTNLRLDDTALTAASKVVDTAVPNTFNASLTLKPRDGFSASGMNCSLSATRKASIGDSMGGSLSSNNGVVSMKGRETSLNTSNASEFKLLCALSNLVYLENFTSSAVQWGDQNVTGEVKDKDGKTLKGKDGKPVTDSSIAASQIKINEDGTQIALQWYDWLQKVFKAYIDLFGFSMSPIKAPEASSAKGKYDKMRQDAADATKNDAMKAWLTDPDKGKKSQTDIDTAAQALLPSGSDWNTMTDQQKKPYQDQATSDMYNTLNPPALNP